MLPFGTGDVAAAIPSVVPADIIFFAALPDDAPDGVRLLRQAGINVPVVGGDAFDAPHTWAAASDLSNVYFTTHAYLGEDSTDPDVIAFRQAYFAKYQEQPNAFAALGYDAAMLLTEAMKNASNPTADNVRLEMESIQNFSGLTGNISYDADHHIPDKTVTILQVSFGSQKFVTELQPEVVPDP
jgi:branched-chain amino acid transport system substrate-binding protein